MIRNHYESPQPIKKLWTAEINGFLVVFLMKAHAKCAVQFASMQSIVSVQWRFRIEFNKEPHDAIPSWDTIRRWHSSLMNTVSVLNAAPMNTDTQDRRGYRIRAKPFWKWSPHFNSESILSSEPTKLDRYLSTYRLLSSCQRRIAQAVLTSLYRLRLVATHRRGSAASSIRLRFPMKYTFTLTRRRSQSAQSPILQSSREPI